RSAGAQDATAGGRRRILIRHDREWCRAAFDELAVDGARYGPGGIAGEVGGVAGTEAFTPALRAREILRARERPERAAQRVRPPNFDEAPQVTHAGRRYVLDGDERLAIHRSAAGLRDVQRLHERETGAQRDA